MKLKLWFWSPFLTNICLCYSMHCVILTTYLVVSLQFKQEKILN